MLVFKREIALLSQVNCLLLHQGSVLLTRTGYILASERKIASHCIRSYIPLPHIIRMSQLSTKLRKLVTIVC